jgi:hypothetical protein
MEIPHLSFLAVLGVDMTGRRVSTERECNEARSNKTTVSESVSVIRSKAGRQRKRRKSGNDSLMSTPSAASHAVSKQQEKKMIVFEDHPKAMGRLRKRDCHIE